MVTYYKWSIPIKVLNIYDIIMHIASAQKIRLEKKASAVNEHVWTIIILHELSYATGTNLDNGHLQGKRTGCILEKIRRLCFITF